MKIIGILILHSFWIKMVESDFVVENFQVLIRQRGVSFSQTQLGIRHGKSPNIETEAHLVLSVISIIREINDNATLKSVGNKAQQ